MKKFLSILLCIILVMSVFNASFADEDPEERGGPPCCRETTLTIDMVGEGELNLDLGEHDYSICTYVTLTATDTECYEFVHWEGDLDPCACDCCDDQTMDRTVINPENPSISVYMCCDREITAVFQLKTRYLTVTSEGPGTTTPAGVDLEYDCGEMVDIDAIASSCAAFVGWEGDIGENLATDPSITVPMNMDRDIHAVFVEKPCPCDEVELYVYVYGAGGTASPAGISYHCPGEEVDLLAIPDQGWTFFTWRGGDGGITDFKATESSVIIPEGGTTVAAVFVEDPCPCDKVELYVYVEDGDGVASPAGTSLHCVGDEVDLSATPDSGWEFVEWLGDPVDEPFEEKTMIVIPEGGATVGAVFSPIATSGNCTLTVTHEGDGYTVPSGATVVSCGTVDLKAYADEGWAFKYWEGAPVADMYDPMTTITVSTDSAVHAVFEDQYVLNIAIEGNGETDPAAGNNYYAVTSPAVVVDLDTDPDSGWYFYRWEGLDAGDISGGEIVMDADKELVAVFRRRTSSSSYGGIFIQHILSISVEGNGTVDPFVGSKKYTPGTIVDLGVNPASGWTFVGWLGPDGGAVVNDQIEMDDDKTLIARFEGSSPPVEPPVQPPEIVIPLVETPLGGGDLPDTSQAIPWMNLVLGFFLFGIGYKNKNK